MVFSLDFLPDFHFIIYFYTRTLSSPMEYSDSSIRDIIHLDRIYSQRLLVEIGCIHRFP